MAHSLPLVCAPAGCRHMAGPELRPGAKLRFLRGHGRPRAVRPQRQPECSGAGANLRFRLNSQSVRTTESGGPRGYDAGKKVWGPAQIASDFAASVTSWSIQTDARWCCKQDQPRCRIATGRCRCSRHRAAFIPFFKVPSPAAVTPASVWPQPHSSSSRSFASRQARPALPSSQDNGPSSVPSHGLAATGALPETSKRPSRLQQPSSTPLPPCCLPEGSDVPHEFRDGP